MDQEVAPTNAPTATFRCSRSPPTSVSWSPTTRSRSSPARGSGIRVRFGITDPFNKRHVVLINPGVSGLTARQILDRMLRGG